MTDILSELAAVHRETGSRTARAASGTEVDARTVVLRRRYDTTAADLWDAVTDPERLRRWFVPVTGDLRLGGRYQVQGNAGGEIVRCEPPSRLTLTWFMGEPKDDEFSQVDVELSEVDGGTTLTLTHVATPPPEFWTQFGPGAVGVGWDLTLLGLAGHVRGEDFGDHEAFERSPEARQFMTDSAAAWGSAMTAAGYPDDQVRTAVAGTTSFYVPPLEP